MKTKLKHFYVSFAFVMLLTLCFSNILNADEKSEAENIDNTATTETKKIENELPDLTPSDKAESDIYESDKEIGKESRTIEFGLTKGHNLGEFTVENDDNTFELPIKNNGSHGLYNVGIELVLPKNMENLIVSNRFAKGNITIKEHSDHLFRIPFTLNKSTPSGRYDITIRMYYTNIYNKRFVREFPMYFYVKNTSVGPIVGISNYSFEKGKISSTEASKMTLKISNLGDSNAKNVSVKIDGLNHNSVYLVDDLNIRKIPNLDMQKETEFTFNMQASPSLKKDAELDIVINYTDALEQVHEIKEKIIVPYKEAVATGELKNLDLKFSKAEYHIYGDGKVKVDLALTNLGTKEIKDLKLKTSVEGSLTFVSKYLDLIDIIKPSETLNFSYTLQSSDSSVDGSHAIMATVTSINAEGEDAELNSKIEIAGIVSHKKDDEEKEKGGKKPKIIIADYSINGEKIVAGKPFELSIVVKNTSKNIGVKNVKMTYSSENEIFIPIDAANSFFIENIPPNSEIQKIIKLTTKSDSEAKMYKMTFSGEYEDETGKSYDEKGNPYKSEESIVLNLTQDIRLEIPELKIQEIGAVGESIPLDLEFYNMGKAPLYNMMVKLEGNFDTDTSNYFVGNFEASKSDMFSAKITPTEAGELKGKLIFEFEDEATNKHTVEKEFTINVEDSGMNGMGDMDGKSGIDGGFGNLDGKDSMEGMDGMDGMGDMEFDENGNPIPKKQGLSITTLALIALAVIVFIIILIVILKKRKKRKIEKLLLEGEDEDK